MSDCPPGCRVNFNISHTLNLRKISNPSRDEQQQAARGLLVTLGKKKKERRRIFILKSNYQLDFSIFHFPLVGWQMFNYAVDLQAIKQSRNVIKAIWRRKRVKSFEIWRVPQRVFLFTVFSFLRICSSVNMQVCVRRHIPVFIFLPVHTTFNQDSASTKSC